MPPFFSSVSMLSRVVLPAPDGPMMASTEPLVTSPEMPPAHRGTGDEVRVGGARCVQARAESHTDVAAGGTAGTWQGLRPGQTHAKGSASLRACRVACRGQRWACRPAWC